MNPISLNSNVVPIKRWPSCFYNRLCHFQLFLVCLASNVEWLKRLKMDGVTIRPLLKILWISEDYSTSREVNYTNTNTHVHILCIPRYLLLSHVLFNLSLLVRHTHMVDTMVPVHSTHHSSHKFFCHFHAGRSLYCTCTRLVLQGVYASLLVCARHCLRYPSILHFLVPPEVGRLNYTLSLWSCMHAI